jgi:dihydrofolate reductase
MRKVIFAINMSLDGCCDHTKFMPDEETYEYFTQLVRDAGAFVYGRKTYELMVPYWPDIAKNHSGDKADNEYAQAFVSVNKMVVFSKSLNSVEEKNTKIVRGNIEDTILKLKQEEGKYILTGGINIPSQLAALGLIDEYLFVVHPIVVGEGRRLLEGIGQLKLKLVETKIFKSRVVLLRYAKQ